tara:strand:+ start:3103 stop:3444 length:342 start_codon:yes stop_codon:yes gene_type:complete
MMGIVMVSMAEMNSNDALKALVTDIGNDIVIDGELLEGCDVAPDELDEMDETQAAVVAAHVFQILFEHVVQDKSGASADPDEGVWSGLVDGFQFEIERDPAGDLLVSFYLVGS